jgi:SAM-dependent methyltransferase
MDAPALSRSMVVLHDPGRLSVSRLIAPRDGMFQGNEDHYFSVGFSAIRSIETALLAAHAEEPRRILDLPCGHGRVLRMLRARFPDAEIAACDIERDGVDFCASTFGARPFYSVEDPDALSLPGQYDLIWCGSLFTHLPEPRWNALLRLFERALAPGGVLVFTTHGRQPESWLRTGTTKDGLTAEKMYGLPPQLIQELMQSHESRGFGYVDYLGQRGYGISLSSLPFVVAKIQSNTSLELVLVVEHGWDEHQDVVACEQPR